MLLQQIQAAKENLLCELMDYASNHRCCVSQHQIQGKQDPSLRTDPLEREHYFFLFKASLILLVNSSNPRFETSARRLSFVLKCLYGAV